MAALTEQIALARSADAPARKTPGGIGDSLFRLASYGSALLVLLFLVGILGSIAYGGWPAFREFGSFFEKLFGIGGQQTPALAYAALESPSVDLGARRRLTPLPVPDGGGAVAIYNISARTVTLPNGETLEAHSGLGESMDDPRYVDRRMRGATPPGTYDLTEREQLFHGVRALRLNPIGGSAAVHNRTGLLAHSYLLGPSGASNGCVSFKDYQKFLTAYLRGEFQRLVVVPGQGQDVLPVVASRAAKVPGRLARGSGNMRVATLP